MLKNLLTIVAFAAIAVNAQALDILSSFGSTKWNSSYNETTKTVTFTDAWGGCGWWVGSEDYSDYASLDVTIEPSTLDLYLVVAYDANGEDKDMQSFPVGATDLSLTLNAEKSAHVYSMYLSCGDLTATPTVTLTAASLTPKISGETVTVFEGDFDLGSWDKQLDLPIAKFATAETDSKIRITYTLNDGADYGAISLTWIDKEWNWVAMTSLSAVDGYNEGGYIVVTSSGELNITLNATDANNLANGGGQEVVVKGANLSISKIELVDDTSAITPVIWSSDLNTTPEYFDMQGRRILNPTSGNLYIVRRGSTVTKQIIR